MPPTNKKVDINAVNATTGKSNAQVLAEAGAVLNKSLTESPNPNIKPVNVPATNTIISTSSLSNTPNVVIPPPINNNTASNSLGATANGVVFGAEQSNANINNQSIVKSERQTYADKLKEAIGIQGTKGNFTLQAQNDAKLAEKNQALIDINNEAITTKNAYEKQINDLYGSPGKTTAQVDQEAGAIRRQANQELSNIGIRQLVAQNNVLGAQKIIDDKVSAKFEPIDNQIKSYAQLIDIIDSDPQEKARLNAILAEKQSKFELNQNAYKTALNNAVQNGAPQAILSAIDKAAGDPNATAGTILASAGQYGVDKLEQLRIQQAKSGLYTDSLQQKKLLAELNPSPITQGANSDLTAYASQYADTGKLPTPSELKQSGLSVGQVTSFAKQMPKPNGAIVSTNTGTKSSALSDKQVEGISALNEIVNKTIPDLKDRFGKIKTGIFGGIGGSIITSQDRQDYNTFRQEFLSKLLVARSGAAVTEQEYERYSKLLPTTFNQPFFFGSDGLQKLNSLENSMKGNLDNVLKSNQQSIYGYSKVKVGGVDRTVGEVIDIGGQQYKVLPDGTLTDII